MPTRETIEKYQVVVLAAAIGAGLGLGAWFPRVAAGLEVLIWPALGVLLYATFTQVPLEKLPEAFADRRFLLAAVIGNFLILPPVAFGLSLLVPEDPAVRLGVLLVLLVPCTDWFIAFTQLARGDTKRAIAFTPLSLLLQLALLALYLWLFIDTEVASGLVRRELLWAFCGLIVAPMLAAWWTRHGAGRGRNASRLVRGLAWLPVPMLAVVVFLIAASQFQVVAHYGGALLPVAFVYIGFIVAAVTLARLLAAFLKLPRAQGVTLAFSFGTRNSFVVLPFALALPAVLEAAAVVVVLQSLVELLGMVVLLWLVPVRLFPARALAKGQV